MSSFGAVLRNNRNCRNIWIGQVVSEVGDHFNSVAVLSLTLHLTGSGLVVGGVMLARTLPAIIAGPLAGVALDRFDRRKIMLASDLIRAVFAIGFVLCLTHHQVWLLYALSALLTFASPFFTSGRSAILPRITSREELHTANALMQTTAWLTLSVGAMLGGISTGQFGYEWAFVGNALSFLVSAVAVWSLRSPEGHFRALNDGPLPDGRGSMAPERETGMGTSAADERRGAIRTNAAQANAAAVRSHAVRDWTREFADGWAYMRRTPLIFAIGMAYVGWASGGGAAQILFSLFGELVYKRGPAGIGILWGSAGLGLVIGGVSAHRFGPKLRFRGYKHAISIGYLIHGVAYSAFAIAPTIWLSAAAVAVSRIAMGSNNVLNRTMLLTHVPDRYRGRVFSTVDTMLNSVMMISMALSSIATKAFGIREIGFVAGCLSASTALFWALANASGRLPEPVPEKVEDEQDYETSAHPA